MTFTISFRNWLLNIKLCCCFTVFSTFTAFTHSTHFFSIKTFPHNMSKDILLHFTRIRFLKVGIFVLLVTLVTISCFSWFDMGTVKILFLPITSKPDTASQVENSATSEISEFFSKIFKPEFSILAVGKIENSETRILAIIFPRFSRFLNFWVFDLSFFHFSKTFFSNF